MAQHVFVLSGLLAIGTAFALFAAAPSAVPATIRTVTLTPVEVASAYAKDCGGVALQPPYPHAAGTVVVGALSTGQMICPAYQGLVRFDLDGLDAASIASARLFYESKQNYNAEGRTERGKSACVGSVGTTGQTWNAEEKTIAAVLAERDTVHLPRAAFRAPPVDIAPLLRAHLDEVKANGLVFSGTVEVPSMRHCLAAVGHIELRLGISAAP